jgi:hypothetical protein
MPRLSRILLTAIALTLPLAGCESLDPDNWSFLDTKKKLPGERRDVFPEGVPGVRQGVPPELVKGYQPPPEPPPTPVAVQAEEPPKPKPKKPKVSTKLKPPPRQQPGTDWPQDAPQQQPPPARQAASPQPGASQWPSNANQPVWPGQPASGTVAR